MSKKEQPKSEIIKIIRNFHPFVLLNLTIRANPKVKRLYNFWEFFASNSKVELTISRVNFFVKNYFINH